MRKSASLHGRHTSKSMSPLPTCTVGNMVDNLCKHWLSHWSLNLETLLTFHCLDTLFPSNPLPCLLPGHFFLSLNPNFHLSLSLSHPSLQWVAWSRVREHQPDRSCISHIYLLVTERPLLLPQALPQPHAWPLFISPIGCDISLSSLPIVVVPRPPQPDMGSTCLPYTSSWCRCCYIM